jgi:hypothetical protein
MNAVITEQVGDLADPADVLGAVGRAEAEVGAQAVADVVAVQHHRLPALEEQAAFQFHRRRRLARARQAGQPQHAAVVAVGGGAGRRGDLVVDGMEVVGLDRGGSGIVHLSWSCFSGIEWVEHSALALPGQGRGTNGIVRDKPLACTVRNTLVSPLLPIAYRDTRIRHGGQRFCSV